MTNVKALNNNIKNTKKEGIQNKGTLFGGVNYTDGM